MMKVFGKIVAFMLLQTFYHVSKGSLIDNFWIDTPDSGNISVFLNDYVVDYSTDLADYGFDVRNQSFVIFELKSCKDAFLTLIASYDRNFPILYEVTIGGSNDKKVVLNILNGPGSDLTIDALNLLNCKMFRQFWLSWGVLGEIRLGIGLIPYTNDVLTWTPGTSWDISFKGISIRTGWGSTGRWIIYNKANPDGSFCGNSKAHSKMNILFYLTTRSLLKCSEVCNRHEDCLALNYHRPTQKCRILYGNQLIKSSYNDEWVFLVKCLQGKHVCVGCM